MSIEIAILAGGESMRMGQDKPSIVWNGRSLLHIVAEQALATGIPVCVIGRSQPPGWLLSKVTFYPDQTLGQGPLGGLLTALSRPNVDTILALASDMPLLKTSGIEWLLGQGQKSAPLHDGLAVTCAGSLEPLFSIYTKSSLPLVERQLARGSKALHKLITVGNFQTIEAPAEIASQLTNVNTPADLAALAATA